MVGLHRSHVAEGVVEMLVDLFALLVRIQIRQLLSNLVDEGVEKADCDLREEGKILWCFWCCKLSSRVERLTSRIAS